MHHDQDGIFPDYRDQGYVKDMSEVESIKNSSILWSEGEKSFYKERWGIEFEDSNPSYSSYSITDNSNSHSKSGNFETSSSFSSGTLPLPFEYDPVILFTSLIKKPRVPIIVYTGFTIALNVFGLPIPPFVFDAAPYIHFIQAYGIKSTIIEIARLIMINGSTIAFWIGAAMTTGSAAVLVKEGINSLKEKEIKINFRSKGE